MVIVAVALIGWLLALPLNLLIDRLPTRQPLLAWPACRCCGARRPLPAYLPLVGWLLARRHCESCPASPRGRALLVEAGLPLVGIGLALHLGGNARAVLYLLLAAYLIAVAAIDLEHRLVLNRMTGAGLLGAVVIAAAGLGPSLPDALLGALVGFLCLFLPALFLPGLGMGDVKLAAVIGALVGFPAVFTALELGVLLGGLSAGLLLATRRVDRRSTIAYAPYLVVGVSMVLFGLIG